MDRWRQWGHIPSIDNSHLTGRTRAWLDRFACGCTTAVSLSSTGATAANPSSAPTTTGTALPAASANSPGLEWQKVLVRHGDWTRDAVVFVAVLRVGWTDCRVEVWRRVKGRSGSRNGEPGTRHARGDPAALRSNREAEDVTSLPLRLQLCECRRLQPEGLGAGSQYGVAKRTPGMDVKSISTPDGLQRVLKLLRDRDRLVLHC
jgi:hypothetical protein